MLRLMKRWKCTSAVILLVLLSIAVIYALLYFAPHRVRSLLEAVGGKAARFAEKLPPAFPDVARIDRVYWLQQNWDDPLRFRFHHTTQGTATFPIEYDWFLALEKPQLSLVTSPGFLREPEYLRRFGFIPSMDAGSFRNGGNRLGNDSKQQGCDAAGRKDGPDGLPDNFCGLPIGFARMPPKIDPVTGKQIGGDRIGLTCAACHTGQIEYKNAALRFDGGPAMLNLGNLERAIGLSIGYTLKILTRFDRFAAEVERLKGKPVDRKELRDEMEKVLKRIEGIKGATDGILATRGEKHIEEGFGRLDALNRIGNQVFYIDMLPALSGPRLNENFHRIDAPVSFPPIWSVSWFNWAQYDASVSNVLVRNAGEALGVRADVNLADKRIPFYQSSIELGNIDWMEQKLRGPSGPLEKKEFQGLRAPKWEEAEKIFKDDPAWAIDKTLAARGKGIYYAVCAECHRGPVREQDEGEKSFWNPQFWFKAGNGESHYRLKQMEVAHIGTDPQQSIVLTQRRVNLPDILGLNPSKYLNQKGDCGLPEKESDSERSLFALALMAVVGKTVDRWHEVKQTPKDEQERMWGTLKNCQNPNVFKKVEIADTHAKGGKREEIVTIPHYRVRPLDGVWATAPYLHNGSVPTLYDMLLPQYRRPAKFCVGDRQFDPVKVGLVTGDLKETKCAPGLTRFDVGELGNSNRGHSFEGTETDVRKLPPGVFGREFGEDERKALLEYLKTL